MKTRKTAVFLPLMWLVISTQTEVKAEVTDHNDAAETKLRFVDAAKYGSPLSLEMVWIEPGQFVMGDQTGTGQEDEQPLRRVSLNGFWMMRTEVTREAYAAFVRANNHDTGDHCWVFEDGWRKQAGLNWQNPGFTQEDTHPATCVNWYDAQAFIRWLNTKSGLKLRLPTEAEWEFAARAGTSSSHYTGDDMLALCRHANGADLSALKHYPSFSVNQCDDGFVRTSPVGSFPANANGLYDMYGNVWEWIQDCWVTHYRGAPTTNAANLNGDCSRRGFRGGGYGDIPAFTRSSLRNRDKAQHRKDDIGFRLVLDTLPDERAD